MSRMSLYPRAGRSPTSCSVTRLIKLAKSQKPTRDSLLASSSSSTLTKVPEVQTSTKLTSAQSELQACEAHLAAKERELDVMRNVAVKSGLSARCKALVECGWSWGEMGKEGLRALESLDGTLHMNGSATANGLGACGAIAISYFNLINAFSIIPSPVQATA